MGRTRASRTELTALALDDYCREMISTATCVMAGGRSAAVILHPPTRYRLILPAVKKWAPLPTVAWHFSPRPTVSLLAGYRQAGTDGNFHSVSKLPTVKVTGGQLLNVRLNQNSLMSEPAISRLAALLNTFFEMDGWHASSTPFLPRFCGMPSSTRKITPD